MPKAKVLCNPEAYITRPKLLRFDDDQRWKTLSKSEYFGKNTWKSNRDIEALKIASYINGTHFSIQTSEPEQAISTTQRDYFIKEIKPLENYKALVASYQKYPPIGYDDIFVEKSVKKSNYQDSYLGNKNESRVYSVYHNKNPKATNFVLGNESEKQTFPQSVTKSAHNLSKSLPVHHVHKSIGISHVLNLPDCEYKDELTTIMCQNYKMDPNIDPKSLKVDMSIFVKDLKSTHFELGNTEPEPNFSQYQASFKEHSLSDITPTHRFRHFPSNVPLNEEPIHTKTGQTHYKTDYPKHKLEKYQKHNAVDRNERASETKGMEETTSISLGTEEILNKSSITQTSYQTPNATKPKREKYISPYNPVSDEPDILPKKSETFANFSEPVDYTKRKELFWDGLQRQKESSHFLRNHHYELGNDAPSSSHAANKNNANEEKLWNVESHKRPKPLDYSYGTTLHNTITRFPDRLDSTTYKTVNKGSYGHFPTAPEYVKPLQPPNDILGFLICEDGAKRDQRDFVTVTQKNFVKQPTSSPVHFKAE